MLHIVAVDMRAGCALVQINNRPVQNAVVLPPHEQYYLLQTIPRGFEWSELLYDEAFHLFARLTHANEGIVRTTYQTPFELADTLRKYQG